MKTRTFQMEAVTELAPSADWYIGPDQILVWRDDVAIKPSESAIQEKMAELKAEFGALEYARNRELEYPTVQELVVALYDEDDKAAIETKRAEIKAKYPKP